MEEQDDTQEGKLLLNDDNTDPDENGIGYSKLSLFATFISAFGVFMIGYDTGIISGSMVLITKKFSLSFLWQEMLVSFAIGPAILGAFCGGYFNDCIGRKKTLLMSSSVAGIGSMVMCFAPSKEILLVGRIITGIAIGFTCITSNLYISECAPFNIRGKSITVATLCITSSQFFAAVISGIFSKNEDTGWRYMLGLGVVPAFVLFVGTLMIPESPRWLISKGRMEEATKNLQALSNTQDVKMEISEIRKQHEMLKQDGNTSGILFRMLKLSSTRRALLVTCGIMSLQQLCIINTVMYYTATIIKMAGVQDDQKAIWLAAAVSFANFLFTFLGFFLVDRIGRRKLVLTSLAGVFFSLILLTVAFYLQVKYSPKVTTHQATMDSLTGHFHNPCLLSTTCDQCLTNHMCGFCYLDKKKLVQNSSCLALANITLSCDVQQNFQLTNDVCPSTVAWLAVLGMVVYLACFAPGMGPVPYVISSEIFPLWARPTGMACATASNHFFSLIVTMTFLDGTKLLTKSGWFGLAAGISMLGWIFLYFFIPETKGKRLEHMHELFKVNGP